MNGLLLVWMFTSSAARQDLQEIQHKTEQGHLFEAMADLEDRYSELDENGLFYLAYVQQYAGEYENCRATLQEVLKRNPEQLRAARDHANLAWFEGDYSRALKELETLQESARASGAKPDLLPWIENDVDWLRGQVTKSEDLAGSLGGLRGWFWTGLAAVGGMLVVCGWGGKN